MNSSPGKDFQSTEDGTNWVYRDSETQKDSEDRPARDESLVDYVAWACAASRKVARQADDRHRWQTSTFHFVRLCRAKKEFDGMNPKEFLKAVPWHSTDFDEDEILTAVVEFGKVRAPAGQDPLMSALWLSKERPVMEGKRFSYLKNFSLFLTIAYHLQRIQGDGPVYLPCHRLAPLLGVTPRIVSQYRQMAKMHGYLKEVSPHTSKRATRFRVNLEAFPKNEDTH